ncbi:hypothetical protein NMG60_11015614 [Bertholletia excelsa]
MKPSGRRLLQDKDTLPSSSPATNANGTFTPSAPFDSSMALTVLVLLTAFFFMGFFSIYFCRLVDDNAADPSRRRRHRALPSSYPSKPKGLDPSAVQALPVFSYTGDSKHPIDCAICLSEFEERETVKMIPYCHHLFHPECIDMWLLSHVSCPLCRCTQVLVVKGACSGVKRAVPDHHVCEVEETATVESRDTCVEVGPSGLRRASSLSALGSRAPLWRSSSF